MAYRATTRGPAYVQKMRAELRELQARGVRMSGNAFAPLLFAKGLEGPAERDGKPLLSGADGKALRAAALKLGYEPEGWAAIAATVEPGLFRQAVAALDPHTLVACDEPAAELVRNAFADDLCDMQDLSDAMLVAGHVAHVAGMRVLNLGGFEAALADDRQKQVMWARLKRIPPLAEPY